MQDNVLTKRLKNKVATIIHFVSSQTNIVDALPLEFQSIFLLPFFEHCRIPTSGWPDFFSIKSAYVSCFTSLFPHSKSLNTHLAPLDRRPNTGMCRGINPAVGEGSTGRELLKFTRGFV